MKITILMPQVIQQLGNRSNQEDSVFPKLNEATKDDRLFVLCDGMGGHENGEVASQLVCEVLPAYIRAHWEGGSFTDELLQAALDEVYSRINEHRSNSLRRMGTTLTFLCVHKGGVTMAHIGDSRVYHIRPSEHLVLYKSRDHSLAYDLFLSGSISREELATYKKNVITRAIMPGMEEPFHADIAHTADVRPGDYFLLCSDGMLEQMGDGDLVELLSADMDNERKQELLIERTKDNQDNHSAILVQVEGVETEKGDDLLVSDEPTIGCNAVLLEKDTENTLQSSVGIPYCKLPLILMAILLILALVAIMLFL